MSKCVTMYEENKPSTLINDVQEWRNFFRAILVRSAMPKIYYYFIIINIYKTFIYLMMYYYTRLKRETAEYLIKYIDVGFC